MSLADWFRATVDESVDYFLARDFPRNFKENGRQKLSILLLVAKKKKQQQQSSIGHNFIDHGNDV